MADTDKTAGDDGEYEPLDDVMFPWNDALAMTNGVAERATVICLNAVFEAIQALRADLRVAATHNQQGAS
jgi:hypothetical protein